MAVTKDDLLAHLQGLRITVDLYEHPVVMTVEEQGIHVGHVDGVLTKNLFLKDKKGRLYLVSATATTNVDLKLLSQRLGLGKGGLRMAPEDALLEILKVPLGSVTPFALINSSARSVILLLDQSFKSQPKIFFHPLINDSSVVISSSELEVFLKSIDRDPCYVDLEAVITVGKDQPPDLAIFLVASPEQDANPAPVMEKLATPQAIIKRTTNEDKPVSKVKPASAENTARGKTLKKPEEDPEALLKYIFDKTITASLMKARAEVGKDQINEDVMHEIFCKVKEEIGQDLQSVLMMFMNTAYTRGFKMMFMNTAYTPGFKAGSSKF